MWLFYFFVGFALVGPALAIWDRATRCGDEAFREALYEEEDRDHATH